MNEFELKTQYGGDKIFSKLLIRWVDFDLLVSVGSYCVRCKVHKDPFLPTSRDPLVPLDR